MKELRILHTNFLRGWGGQSNRILLLCRGLRECGHFVMISAPADSELIRRARIADIPVFENIEFRRGFHPLSLHSDARKLKHLFAKYQFQIIHTHGSQDSWASALAFRKKGTGSPIIIRTRHNLFPIKDHIFNRWLYGRFFDHIICISRQIKDDCSAKPYINEEKLSVIHSAIAPEKLRPVSEGEKSHIRQKLGIQDELVVGTVARLRPEKGLDVLLRAMQSVVKKINSVKLLIVGEGSMKETLIEETRRLSLAEKVIFAGFWADTTPLLDVMDIFVMPSLTEGLGTAVMEAAARGLPIVASRVGGILDIIEHNVSGLLVEPNDPNSLAQALLTLALNKELARRLGATAQKVATQSFSVERLVKDTESLYFSLLKKKAHSRKTE